MYTVDVIIPTYKPDREFFHILDMLENQTVKPAHIIIMNTEEKYFDQLVFGSDFLKKYGNCKVYHHSKREFDHGATRNRGVSHSKAEYFVKKKAAVSYARQLPKEDCRPIERYTRSFNYPEESCLKGEQDVSAGQRVILALSLRIVP